MKKFRNVIVFLAIIGVVAGLLCISAAGAGETPYLSPETVLTDGETVYVADFTSKDIKVLQNNALSGTVALSGEPTGLAQDGENLYVTVGTAEGKLAVINKASREVSYISTNGHTPVSPVVSGTTAYVSNRFSGTVSVIDLDSKTVTASIPASREPIAAVLNGSTLYVASHLPSQNANPDPGEKVACELTVIDTATNTVSSTLALDNGTIDIKDMATDGEYLYIPHILARYMLPTSQLDRGWINTNAMTIVDCSTNQIVTSVILDDVDWGAANPYGAYATDSQVIVSHSGTHELTVIDKAEMFDRINGVENGTLVKDGLVESVEDIPNDISFMYGAKTRVKLSGNGARGIDVSGNNVYTAQYFTGNVARYNLVTKELTTISLGQQPAADDIRKGEMYWNDGTQCFQQWQSCISCHPDGRVDGLNWDNLNDGLGNPKQTKSMLAAHQTPPTMITGIRADAETAVRAGMKYIQFNVLPEEDLACIDEYLASLKPVASPYLVNGQYSEKALRGKAIYEDPTKGNCAGCHPSTNGLYTDMRMHYVGSNSEPEMFNNRAFDTPTLLEVWRTGPYFADGRAVTMTEALTTATDHPAHNMKMTTSNRTQPLTDEEISDLVEYVMSISTVEESIRAYYVVESLVAEDGTVKTVTVRKDEEFAGAPQLIVAVYVDNELANYKIVDVDPAMPVAGTDTLDINIPAPEGSSIKAFMWDSMDKVTPLSVLQ